MPRTDFDPYTSELKHEQDDIPLAFNSYYSSYNTNYESEYSGEMQLSFFENHYSGMVLGAKPADGQCMPARDTPIIPITTDNISQGFAYYLNMDDKPNHDQSLVDSRVPDLYGSLNFIKNESFFIGGIAGCPENVLGYVDPQPELKRETLPQRLAFRHFEANWCYKYFLLSLNTDPGIILQRSIETRDPLSRVDPERSYLNNCQNLINGSDAFEIEFGKDKTSGKDKHVGYASVHRYDLAQALNIENPVSLITATGNADDTHNEEEYLLSDIVQTEWNKAFANVDGNGVLAAYPQYKLNQQLSYNFPTASLPCLVTNGERVGNGLLLPPRPSPPPIAKQCTNPYSGYYDQQQNECGKPWYPLPADYNSTLPTRYDKNDNEMPYYCPNVEKITVPADASDGGLYIPRKDIDTRYYATDRGYSTETSKCIQDPTQCNSTTQKTGYTDFNDWRGGGTCPVPGSPPDNINQWIEHNEYPVECGIVPVDILAFRAEAFHSCIMQRINYNLDAFITQWTMGTYPGDTQGLAHFDGTGWEPPCKTRFFETDTFSQCPVKLSIQQCCHIIIKDVVPANFVKFRTKEGLRQPRIDANDGTSTSPNAPPPNPNCNAPVQDAAGNNSDHFSEDFLVRDYDVTTDTFPTGPKALQAAMKATEALNKCSTGDNTEPPEYLFSNYVASYSEERKKPADCAVANNCFLGYHMPYMRWWDTGVSAGNPRHGGSFLNTLGGFDTAIGVGREEISKQDVKDAQDRADYAAYNDDTNSYGPQDPGVWTKLDIHERNAEMGRIGGLTELYAAAVYALRYDNLGCIARYEKGPKLTSPENFVLAKAGSSFTNRGNESKKILSRPWAWSLGWRGYVTAWESTPFPDFGGAPDPAAMIQGGLDNAKAGDIIVYNLPGKPAQIAFVTNAEHNAEKGLQFIDVEFWDQGKYPSSTGSSIMAGMKGSQRHIYKTMVPKSNELEVCNTTLRVLTEPGNDSNDYYSSNSDGYGGTCASDDNDLDPSTCMQKHCQPSCIDSDYLHCVLGGNVWHEAKIYRRKYDTNLRRCSGDLTYNGDSTIFDWGATYDWRERDANGELNPVSAIVMYQHNSNQVDADILGQCVNDGKDPPSHWSPNEFSGALTGDKVQLFLCGPGWGNCSQSGDLEYFPKKSGE